MKRKKQNKNVKRFSEDINVWDFLEDYESFFIGCIISSLLTNIFIRLPITLFLSLIFCFILFFTKLNRETK